MAEYDLWAPENRRSILEPSALYGRVLEGIPNAADFVEYDYIDWTLIDDCFDARYARALRALDKCMTDAEDAGRKLADTHAIYAGSLIAVLVVVLSAGMFAIGSAL